MKTITDKEYWDVTHCTPDFRIGNITLEEAQEFLNRKGYDIIIHKAIQHDVDHKRSVPGTGEVESIGRFTTDMSHVLAVKSGVELPILFTIEYLKENGISSVLYREIRKNLLA